MTDAHIYIVEDDHDILELLEYSFSTRGYRVSTSMDGADAIARIPDARPDLILLDLLLPNTDGIQVCRVLQQTPVTAAIPVVMLTAKGEEQDIIHGLNAGAVDYIQKPFSCAELLARIARHLEQFECRRRLEGTVESRERQLVHADRLASIGTMVAGLIHEINNANMMIHGNAQLLGDLVPHIRAMADRSPIPANPSGQDRGALERFERTVRDIAEGSNRIDTLTRTFRRYSRADSDGPQMQSTPLRPALESALRICNSGRKRRARVTADIAGETRLAIGRGELEQVLVNLLVNAEDAIAERREGHPAHIGQIDIAASEDAESARIDITDNGCGMTAQQCSQAFEEFYTTKTDQRGTGLGLGIVRQILQKHGGTIELQSDAGSGTIVTIRLPVARTVPGEADQKQKSTKHFGIDPLPTQKNRTPIPSYGKSAPVFPEKSFRQ